MLLSALRKSYSGNSLIVVSSNMPLFNENALKSTPSPAQMHFGVLTAPALPAAAGTAAAPIIFARAGAISLVFPFVLDSGNVLCAFSNGGNGSDICGFDCPQ